MGRGLVRCSRREEEGDMSVEHFEALKLSIQRFVEVCVIDVNREFEFVLQPAIYLSGQDASSVQGTFTTRNKTVLM